MLINCHTWFSLKFGTISPEKLLEDILQKLPASTTKVIIAHRLNTIANADVIYFVNTGNVTRAGSLNEAVDMLMKGKMAS